ncbi:toxin VasX [Pseudomonas alliivorans]|nr:toxin VasX [Pseudomonas alliivorans]
MNPQDNPRTLPAKDKAYWESRAREHVDSRSRPNTCPAPGNNIQLLPLRYGRVERLGSKPDSNIYARLKRPLGLRLLRDGYLYVIEESSGYLHEYRVENGVPTKLVWKGSEVVQDVRQTSTGEHALVFAKDSILHVAYSELQWTAAKCAQALGSAADRFYFMQKVDLAEADCLKGGVHLRVQKQVSEQLAELAEQPAQQCATPDIPEAEQQDYVWEHQPLFREAHIGEFRHLLKPLHEKSHLYLVLEDSIGILRDLAEEQDTVVGWIEEWRERNNNETRFLTATYIDTLMTVGDSHARQVNPESKLLKKTTPQQRSRIYDFINARNQWRREKRLGPEPSRTPDGHYAYKRGADYNERPQQRFARLDMENKQALMKSALGEKLYGELEEDIEALDEKSQGTLNGVGLGSRGINDLIRHDEMQSYLNQERSHLRRWTQRLDDITHDRISLFTQSELYRSAWYFDPDHPDQLKSALAMELNCTRDLCRTEESLQRVSDYFHDNPHYILPVFYGRLNLEFLRSKSSDLIKWLDDIRTFSGGLVDAQNRITTVSHVIGHHWTLSLHLPEAARPLHQAVVASYIPSIALRMEQWLRDMNSKLNDTEVRQHLNNFPKQNNRAQRLGALVAMQQEAVTLSIANETDVQKYRDAFVRLNHLIKAEDDLIRERTRLSKLSSKHWLTPTQRNELMYDKQYIQQQLLQTRNQLAAIRRELEHAITPTGRPINGAIGVKLNINDAQLRVLEDEIARLRAGPIRGYGTPGAVGSAFKGSLFPMLAMTLQIGNLGEAWAVWEKSEGDRSFKEMVITGGALFSPVAAALSVYQSAHIAIIDNVLRTLATNPAGTAGGLFAVRVGKLGLGLGAFIVPLGLIGAVGTTWNNWEKWNTAFNAGTTGETLGAGAALVGDIGSTVVNAAVTGQAGIELYGLLREIRAAPVAERKLVANMAWATRGARFLRFWMDVTPWALISAALQLGGETLYNYFNLDDQQRWLLGSLWGKEPEGWDWPTHAQKLAEANLRPTIIDKGLIRRQIDGESVRSLQLILPGLTWASFDDTSLRWSAELHNVSDKQDVSEVLRQGLSIVAASPLMLALEIPNSWQGHHAQLLLHLAVKPALVITYLKADQGYLTYRIPLGLDIVSKPVNASTDEPVKNRQLPATQITRECLNDL